MQHRARERIPHPTRRNSRDERLELAQKFGARDQRADEVRERPLVLLVDVDPGGATLRLARRLPRKFAHARAELFALRIRHGAHGPHPHERLIDHVLHLRIGRELVAHALLERAVRALPRRELLRPLVRDLREDVEPRANIRAPLRVVRARGEHRAGPASAPLDIRVVERADCAPKLGGGVRADLVEREERRISIERGVLDPLCRRRPAHLLKANDERIALGPAVIAHRYCIAEEDLFEQGEERRADEGECAGVRTCALECGAIIRVHGDRARLAVCAVDGQARDQLHDPFGELRARERLRARVGARDWSEKPRESLYVRRERAAEDERLAARRDLVEVDLGAANAEKIPIALLDLAAAVGLDEDRVELRQKFVAGGAGDGPLSAEALAPRENLLDEERNLGSGTRLLDRGVEPIEVVAWISQPVDVIDAKTVDLAILHPLDDAPVRCAEDGRILHAERDELVDVEKAAVIDLVRGAAPEDEGVDLRIEQRRDARVGAAIGGEGAGSVLERVVDTGRTGRECFEAAQELGGLLLSALDECAASAESRRKRGERHEDGRELVLILC